MQPINGCLGAWAAKCSKAKPITVGMKTLCLALFKRGTGFHRAARVLGLSPYTVRDWLRRFKSGDESWAARDGRKFTRDAKAGRDVAKRV